MDDLQADVQEVFRDVFDDDQITINDSTTADEVDGWDSLNHISLIIAIEKRYGIKFATAEISRLKEKGQNVGTLVDLIRRKRSSTGK
jgi:acyl carrier protein